MNFYSPSLDLSLLYRSNRQAAHLFYSQGLGVQLTITTKLCVGNGTPPRYSCLENPMDGGAWQAAVHGVSKCRTRLSDFTFTFMHWRRKWQPTPVFLPGESQGRGSMVGCRLWGRTESDTTEVTQQQQQQNILITTSVLPEMIVELTCLQNKPQGPTIQDAIITTEIKNFNFTAPIQIYPSPRLKNRRVFFKEFSYIEWIYMESRKMVQMIYMQSRNRDTEVDNNCMDTKWDRRGWEELGGGY